MPEEARVFKKRKPWWKRWWGILIIIWLGSGAVIGVLQSIYGTDQTVQSPKQEPASSPSSPNSSEGQGLGIWDDFRLGDFTYTVTDVKVTKAIGNELYNKQSSYGASFVVVTFNIENMSKKTKTVVTDDFKIKDKHGRTYSPSAEANTALALTSGKDLILSQLQPGVWQTMKTAFEVPDEVVNNGFFILIPKKGLFSIGEAKVRVPPR